MKVRKVLLTGASGNLGQATLKQLLKMDIDIRLFSKNSSKDRKILKPYVKNDRVSIVYGDIINLNEVREAVQGADVILHTAALVSPFADENPTLTWRINYLGTKNIINAIEERSDSDDVLLVYIGSVSEYGNRAPEVCWGRVGDPLLPVPLDYYALSKTMAERAVIESGLNKWVSLRQTGMLHESLLGLRTGIEYHQPLDNHLEWVTAEDSGRLLARLCDKDIPEEIYRNCFNIGGGESCRYTAYDFMKKMFGMVDIDFRDIYSPDMFALRNFHGMYYLDSDRLESLVPYRRQGLDDFIDVMKKKMPVSFLTLRHLPLSLVKTRIRASALKNPVAPLCWAKNEEKSKIKAFFGSESKMISLDNWDKIQIEDNIEAVVLDHGYDESKPDSELELEDMKKAAEFRGGTCLSEFMVKGDLWTKLKWKCSEGHEFHASPYLVLKTGHFCRKCLMPPWDYDYLAKKSKFIAQVWYQDHDEDEDNIYK